MKMTKMKAIMILTFFIVLFQIPVSLLAFSSKLSGGEKVIYPGVLSGLFLILYFFILFPTIREMEKAGASKKVINIMLSFFFFYSILSVTNIYVMTRIGSQYGNDISKFIRFLRYKFVEPLASSSRLILAKEEGLYLPYGVHLQKKQTGEVSVEIQTALMIYYWRSTFPSPSSITLTLEMLPKEALSLCINLPGRAIVLRDFSEWNWRERGFPYERYGQNTLLIHSPQMIRIVDITKEMWSRWFLRTIDIYSPKTSQEKTVAHFFFTIAERLSTKPYHFPMSEKKVLTDIFGDDAITSAMKSFIETRPSAIHAISNYLNHPDPRIRFIAATVLREMGLNAKDTLHLLKRRVDEENVEPVKKACLSTIRRIELFIIVHKKTNKKIKRQAQKLLKETSFERLLLSKWKRKMIKKVEDERGDKNKETLKNWSKSYCSIAN